MCLRCQEEGLKLPEPCVQKDLRHRVRNGGRGAGLRLQTGDLGFLG